jgi:hypothetical protein
MEGCGRFIRMRAYRWLIITVVAVVGVVVLAIAVGALWLNSYIHSAAFKADVETRASQAVGGPVTIQSINFDIFHGVKLEGFVTQVDPSHAGGQGALNVNIASVNCGYAWSDIFQRKLRFTGVTFAQPQIVLTKQPTAPLTASPTSPATASTPRGPLSGGSSMPFEIALDRAKISDGSLLILDAGGTPMVDFKGVDASADTSGYFDGKDVTGTLKIADMQGSNLHVTSFSTPFTYHANLLDAKPFEGSAFNGTLAGAYHFDGTSASTLELNAKGLDVAQLTAATSSGSSAHLTGSLDFQSKWLGAESGDPNGEGDAQLVNGKLEGVKILHEVGQVLKINEIEEPIISSAKTHFVVHDRQTRFIGLQLNSSFFQLTGDGTIGFNSSLDANLVLILNRDAMGKLPKEVAASFVQQQDGSGSIAFHVTGTTADPKTDLAMRLLMQNTQIKNVINKALNKFFH